MVNYCACFYVELFKQVSFAHLMDDHTKFLEWSKLRQESETIELTAGVLVALGNLCVKEVNTEWYSYYHREHFA